MPLTGQLYPSEIIRQITYTHYSHDTWICNACSHVITINSYVLKILLNTY